MNKTAATGDKMIQDSRTVMSKVGIDYEQWVNLLFDLGCLYAERNAPAYMLDALLQNKVFGYWDWWLVQWMNDDKVLQYMDGITSLSIYKREKLSLIVCATVHVEFKYLLKIALEKI